MFVRKSTHQAVQSELQSLRRLVSEIGALDLLEVQRQTELAQRELRDLLEERAKVEGDIRARRQEVVVYDDTILLQEVGLYRFNHPLEDAVAYKTRLEDIDRRLKILVKEGRAVQAANEWTVNNSKAQGRQLVLQVSRILLAAYNAEVENVLRTLRPHRLPAAIDRVEKLRDRISRNAKIMDIHITREYHSLRIEEIQTTADYLQQVEDEKEAMRAERERLRDAQKAQRELEAEHARLEREAEKYRLALQRLAPDAPGREQLEANVRQVEEALAGVMAREANIRAGYVYVISNIGSFGEDVVKIGLTRRLDPEDRIRELGDASVPFNFDKHALIFTEDAVELEQRLHAYFAHRRINRVNLRREYFRITPVQVLDALKEIGEHHLTEFHEAADALEWRQSLAEMQREMNQTT